MNMRCLIVDDDPLICDLLEYYCSKTDFISQTSVCNNGFEAINLIGQTSFELVLLDFDLPDLTAKDILPIINDYTKVIMVTANKDFGHESYNYPQIVDFLVKPVEFPRFFQGVNKAYKLITSFQNSSEQIFVKDGTSLVSINLNDVLYIKSAGNYAEVYLPNKKIMTMTTLKELETKLSNKFQRVHRTCIVNITKVDKIQNTDLIINGYEIAISNSYKTALLDKIKFLN